MPAGLLFLSLMKCNLLLLCTLLALAFTSCVKDELPNAECDIIAAYLPGDILNGDPIVKNTEVEFHVLLGTEVTALAPQFDLTPGATIVPPSGTVRDFSTPQTYVVTSEDGNWHKTYTVSVTDDFEDKLIYIYKFDNVEQKTTGTYSYDIFVELGADGDKLWEWATANAGFAMSGVGKTPNTFPTYQGTTETGRKCAVLQTLSTGSFGERMKKPIAAGNLYTGTFKTATAITNPLGATHFGEGRTFYRYPIYFRGTYKYTAGPTFGEMGADGKLVPVPGKQDECNIYAVLFRNDVKDANGKVVGYLDGNNVLSADNPAIVATAEISAEQRLTTNGWITFGVPFILRPGKDIDPKDLADGKYNLTIVASSSREGDFFNGAIGSTLMISQLELYCVDEKPDYTE